MKFLVFTDNHFCEHVSIINTFGTNFSTRLENQIKSIEWVEQLAAETGCDAIICAGDFFDKPQLNDREITALASINWGKLPHYFLVGNHDSEDLDLQCNVVKALENVKENRLVISSPTTINVEADRTEICFLPYVVERDRKPLVEYFGEKAQNKKRIIISHNDIKGIQMGPVVSATGFTIDEFEANANLAINGHLHNGMPVSPKVLNLGNLTGRDFGEDASKYPHRVAIIDTNTGSCGFVENPYAFNFYKLEVNDAQDLAVLSTIKNNAVLSIKFNEIYKDQLNEALESVKHKTIKTRLIPYRVVEAAGTEEVDISDLTVDHLPKFISCVREKLGTDTLIESELAEICK